MTGGYRDPVAAAARRLLVDVSVISRGDAGTGIQRVVRALLLQLVKRPPAGFEVTLIEAGRWHRYRRAPAAFAARFGASGGGEAGRKLEAGSGDVFLGLDLATYDVARQRRQFDRWKKSGAKFVFVVYDLLPDSHPEWFSDKAVRAFRGWLREVATHADGAVCISRAVRDEFAQWLRVHAGSRAGAVALGWFHLGGDIAASAPSKGRPPAFDAQLALVASRPSVLMTGTIEPRKGHALVLSAFEALWRDGRDASLVIVGRPGWRMEALMQRLRSHPEAGKRLFWLEDASDEMLSAVYRAAIGLLLASEAEGFGLPMLEAAHFGKPILARDLPVFREVAGRHASYFRGTTPETVAAEIGAWLDRVREKRAASSAELKLLTWERSVRMLSDSLCSVLSSSENQI